jgi:hypothetical protein
MNALTINEVEIYFPQDELGTDFVPVKPICDLLQINSITAINNIKDHPIYGSTTALRAVVAADGRSREMVCLPLKYALVWLLGIDVRNVKSEAKEGLAKYQKICHDAIYDKFFLEPKRQQQRFQQMLRKEAAITESKRAEREAKKKTKILELELYKIKNEDPGQIEISS